jgi:microsomal prostaglandin-E synthase 2
MAAKTAAMSVSRSAQRMVPTHVLQHRFLLYQYEICPFCAKVKGLMDFYGVPYSTVEVNPLNKQELRSVSFFQRKVPFAIFPAGNAVAESSVILQALRDSGDLPRLSSDFATWESWVNTRLSVVLFPNITRNFTESWEAFSYLKNTNISQCYQLLNRCVGSIAMSLASGRIKRKYGIIDERKELLSLLGEWTAAMRARNPDSEDLFFGGSSPCEIDALVFGTIRAIEGTTTLHWVLNNASDEFVKWWLSMCHQVGPKHSYRAHKY